MIRVVASFNLKPEATEQALELAKELVAETRKEDGCVQYDVAQSTETPTDVVVLEAWESKEALDVHSASAHFARIVPQLAEMCVVPPVVSSYVQII